MSSNLFCNGDCASCAIVPHSGQTSISCIKVAVVGLDKTVVNDTARTLGDASAGRVRFFPLDEISSILDLQPDLVLFLVDATDLTGNMYPVTKLIDMDLKVLMVLNNYDRYCATGYSIDFKRLANLLGMKVVSGDIHDEMFRMKLMGHVVRTYEKPLTKDVAIPYGQDIERAVRKISAVIHEGHSGQQLCFSERYVALRLLEHQDYIKPYVESLPNGDDVFAVAGKEHDFLEKEFGEQSEVLVEKARRGFVAGALQETVRHSKDNSDHSFTEKLDAVLTSRIFGFPLLILILLGVFGATFALGSYPQGWIETGVDALARYLHGIMNPGWFSSLLIDGVVQGVGAVIAFIPNIAIMFFFLSILEDSGYMARAAYLMDKVMHAVGLHGRSFVPMLIGFGCNVPAIMAAKSIDNRRERTLTMLMIPFMSCSARLPVYMLFVSAFFPHYKALVMMGLYVLGIGLSILFAFVMKHTRWFKADNEDYVSELPPFRMPTWRNTGLHIWERVADYLQKISTVILAASVIIWALEYFPTDKTNYGENPEESYLASIGKAVAPVMEPLGFDWKMNICLLTGLPAKEAIVSTMGILYHASPDDETDGEESRPLSVVLREEGIFNTASAWAFMLFVLLYFPCVATVSALRKEIGVGWAAFTVVHSMLLAWVVAFCAFHLISVFI